MSLDLDLIYSEVNFKVDKPSVHKVYEFEEFRLDAVHLMLYRENDEISLAPKAVETLVALVERRGEILTKDALMSVIWTDSIVEESNLAQYLHVLRKTLGKRQNGTPFIETLRRRGYRFNGDVSVSQSANGFLPQRRGDVEETKDHFLDNDGALRTKNRNSSPLSIERHGNVLALADWKETGKQRVEEQTPAGQGEVRFRPRIFLAGFLALGAILLVALPFAWSRLSSNSKASAVNGDLTMLNLTSGEYVDFATISPDGNYFVYASHDGEKAHLSLQQTGQTTRLEIIPPIAGRISNTTFTPDSQFIYFVYENGAAPSELYRVPTLGGVRTKILTDVWSPVSFSPDGGEMVFMRLNKGSSESSLVIASSDGMSERILLTRTGSEAISFGGAWSPDGKLIAYGALDMAGFDGSVTITGIDPQSGETKTLSPAKWDEVARMAWTRDGQGLVFSGTRAKESFSTRRGQIYYLSILSGEARRITTAGNLHQYASLGVTDKDEILAVPFNRLAQIWTMDASGDSRTAVQITTGFADGRAGIAPLADGRVAYLTRNGDGLSIWLMNGDGTDRKQLTTDPPTIEELRAASDGRFFVFSARSDGWAHLFRVDPTGGSLKQLTFGDSQEVDSTVSPDGNWIVFGSKVFNGSYGKSTLWKISPDGGEPVRLSDLECEAPHFSPDGKFVSCVSGDWTKISIVSVEDGKTLRTFEMIDNPVLNIGARWTPDGKALAYIVLHKNVGNIRLQPIDGGPPRYLTDFTSGDMYNFAFSADGLRLYVARGYSTRNAVLISNFK
jgi:Tol biopolymer transport system component/DNA-binding winged helix-turn-helix (wHTH) protein